MKTIKTNSPFVNTEFADSLYARSIVEYLYPSSPGYNRKYPLTRCILHSLIEYITAMEPKENHNFKRLLEILDEILCDLSNMDSTKEKGIPTLNYLFGLKSNSNVTYDSVQKALPTWAISAFELFYYYSKIESQRYTVSCLVYELLPYIDMTFAEMCRAIAKNEPVSNILLHQSKQAMYSGNRDLDIYLSTRLYSKILFPANYDIMKNCIFQLAVLDSIKSTSNPLLVGNVKMADIHNSLMDRFKKSCDNDMMGLIAPKMDCPELCIDYRAYLNHILEVADSLSDLIMSTAELTLFYEGTLEEAISSLHKGKKNDDIYFF